MTEDRDTGVRPDLIDREKLIAEVRAYFGISDEDMVRAERIVDLLAAPAAEPVPLTLDARVLDAGGGEVRLLVDRDTYEYPVIGSRVRLVALVRPEPSAQEDREGDAALALAPDFTDYDDD